ncbi:hypothetical protein BVY01_04750 [bacterium I07]|nr:hypothetical protein BVY01_04750 [bacterium I07]
MNRRSFIRQLLGGSVFLSTLKGLSCGTSNKSPNIILIYIDDLGWRDTGFMGSTFYRTPNIDSLAESGMIFTNAYANAPNCAPSRASLMTGLYTPRHGIFTVGSPRRGDSRNRKLIPVPNEVTLDSGFITLPEVLKANGYKTAHMGKWHLGTGPETGPAAQGFDINIGGTQAGSPKSYFSPYRNPKLQDGPPGEYLTDRLTAESIQFIRNHRNEPFFLYLSHYAVHTPIQAKPGMKSKYKSRRGTEGQNSPDYAAMIESVDQGIGDIINCLNKHKLRQDTLILFFSDNGGFGPITSMAPLRGSKGMLYEGGIRVPLIFSWPGTIAAGSNCDVPVIGIDIFPPLLTLAGISSKSDIGLDGECLSVLINQTGDISRTSLYWHFPAYLEAYRGMKGFWRTTPAGAIRKKNWKLIEFFEDDALELYNLEEDIGETRNLIGERPEKGLELLKDLRKWRNSVNAPVPSELNPEYSPY